MIRYLNLLSLLLLVVCATAICTSTQAEPVLQKKQLDDNKLELVINQSAISIADYLNFRLMIEVPAKTGVTFQAVDSHIGPFRVVSRHPLGPLKLDEQREQWVREYVLEAEQTGELTIPSWSVEVGGMSTAARTGCVRFRNCDDDTMPAAKNNESVRSMATDPVMITVTSVVPEDASITEIKDIDDPMGLAPPTATTTPFWQWLLFSSVLLLAVIGFFVSRYRDKSSDLPVTAEAADHLWALQALDQLQQQDLISERRIEEYYLALSSILRCYIAKRFEIAAPERTTAELMHSIRQRPNELGRWRESLHSLLQHCDLVKFARYQASREEMQNSLQKVREFIKKTAPQSEYA